MTSDEPNINDLEQQIRNVFERQGKLLDLEDRSRVERETLTLRPDSKRLSETTGPGRNRNRSVFGVAAAFVLMAVGAFALSESRSRDTVIADDPKPTTTVAEPTPNEQVALGESGLLVPTDQSWLVLRADEIEQEASSDRGEVAVFDVGGSLVILTISPASGVEADVVEFADAEPESLYNRTTIYGVLDDQGLGLTGFDITPEELRSLADTLVEAGGEWSLPGADLVFAEYDASDPGGTSTMIDLAPVDDEGMIDRARTVSLHSIPATEGSLYRTLGEASSLGQTRQNVTIFGTTGFLIGESDENGEGIVYAIAYRDGRLFEAQATSRNVDLEALVSSLEPASLSDLDRRLEETASIMQAELETALAEQEPIKVVELPRFLAQAPWVPERVFDQSLWSDEDRAMNQALFEAQSGDAQSQLTWVQAFDRRADPNPLDPEVLVTTTEVFSFHAMHGGDIDGAPVSIGRFTGTVTGYDNYATLNVIDGNIAFALTSTTLTAAELATFAETLTPREPASLTGLTSNDGSWSLTLDEPSPYAEVSGISNYNTLYSDGTGTEIYVAVDQVPAAALVMSLSWVSQDSSSDLRENENGWLITESWYQETADPRDRSDPPDRIQYQQYDEELGVLITLWGDQPDALEDLALNLNQVDETEWQDAVRATLVPFDPERN